MKYLCPRDFRRGEMEENMIPEEGKYYSQDAVTYKCTRGTEIAVYQALSDLIGIYVEVAEDV